MKLSINDLYNRLGIVSISGYNKFILLCLGLCSLSIILSIAFTQLFAWLVILGSIIHFIRHPKLMRTPLSIPLILFIILRIVSIALSTDTALSLRSLHTEMPYYFLFFVIIQESEQITERYIYVILGLLIAAAIIGSCYGSISVLLGWKPRATSLTSGYYTFGSYVIATLVITLILGKTGFFAANRWLWYILIILMSVGIILTKNRIHWGIMAIVLILVGLLRERRLLAILTVILVLVLAFSPSVSQRFSQTIHFRDNLSGRDVLWKGASLIWLNHPILGYGPDTFSKIFPIPQELQDKEVGGWHNDYLQVFIESGILALLSLIWLIAAMYYQAIVHLRKKDSERKELVLAMTCGITTILLSSLTGSAFLDILIRILFCILLGFFALLRQDKQNVG